MRGCNIGAREGESAFFQPAALEPNQHNRIPEYDMDRVLYLAEAHGWRMIEVKRKP